MNKYSGKYKDFLAEAEDIILELNQNIYELKSACRSAGRGQDPEVVNALFREIHTLKGISEVTGFPRISTLSHCLEDLLDCLRLGRVDLTHDIVDTLFEAADIFMELLKNINDLGVECIEVEPAIDKIRKFIELSKSGDKSSGIRGIGCIPSDLSGRLSEFEQYRLSESLKKGQRLYRIIARVSIDNADVEVEKIRLHFAYWGESIAVIPASGISEDDMISFEFIYAIDSSGLHEDVRLPPEITGIEELEPESGRAENQIPEQDSLSVEHSYQSVKSVTKTVRVDIGRLEMLLNTVGEILLLHNSVIQDLHDLKSDIGNNHKILGINRSAGLLHKKLALLRDGLIDVQLVPIEQLYSRIQRIVDHLSRGLSKKVRVEFCGGDTRLDKSIIEELADPLMHIIRNAIDHGIEDEEVRRSRGKDPQGSIKVRAMQRDSNVVIDIEDDGAGIDYDMIYKRALETGMISDEISDKEGLLKMLFMPGFTTRSFTNDVSGRGVGLDVVAKNIEDLSGIIEIETSYEKGTRFRITLPVTLLIVRALMVSESGRELAIPVNTISENARLKDYDIVMIRDKESINIRGEYLPLIRLKDVLKYPGDNVATSRDHKYIIIAGLAQKRMGIVVDKIYGQKEILLKPRGQFFKEIDCIAGFADIDSSKVVPVVDIPGLVEQTFAQHIHS